jgi:signal transduction histidine kinase
VVHEPDDGEDELFTGLLPVAESPFVLAYARRPIGAKSWLARRSNLILFTGLSIGLIAVVVTWGSMRIGARLVRSDHRRAALYHQLEYTNKMAAIGRLGAGVAHEVNNPLAIIAEKAGLVRDLLTIAKDPPTPEKLLEQIDVIQTSVERCSKITHRLLGFAKHMDVRREEIDLRKLLREVLSFLDKEANYRSLHVELDVPEDFPHIVSDRGQIEQVFLNIINNAFAAVDEGGHITLWAEDTRDGFVVIHVEDDGKGIPPQHLKHVFEPFYTTKEGMGTGLGLSITYGIVEKHGGTISVVSRPGAGTHFSVKLPLEEEA